MSGPEFEFNESESKADDAAGSPEGDGDFETDGLTDTNETSGGGQVGPPHDTRDGVQGRKEQEASLPDEKPTGFRKLLDEVGSGKIQT